VAASRASPESLEARGAATTRADTDDAARVVEERTAALLAAVEAIDLVA